MHTWLRLFLAAMTKLVHRAVAIAAAKNRGMTNPTTIKGLVFSASLWLLGGETFLNKTIKVVLSADEVEVVGLTVVADGSVVTVIGGCVVVTVVGFVVVVVGLFVAVFVGTDVVVGASKFIYLLPA